MLIIRNRNITDRNMELGMVLWSGNLNQDVLDHRFSILPFKLSPLNDGTASAAMANLVATGVPPGLIVP